MQTITVNLNLSRGSCRINQPLYLGETVALSFSEAGAYSLILTEPFADSPKDGIVVWAQSTATGELSLNRKALHSAFKKAEAMQPNMTISAKCFVISEDGQTVADGEVAIEYSPKAFVIDDEDYPLAKELLSQATSAKDQAIDAKDSAIAAKGKAESAQSAAEEAKAQAILESEAATTEREKAQQAATLATEHATIATSASSSALKAQTAAEEAQHSAETAASAAQVAKDEAQGIANETAQQQVEKVRQELLPLISAKANSAEFDKVVEKIATLIGNDDGYSVRQIAAGLVAEVVSGADKNFDTLKEIADWILNDTTGAAALANAAEDLKNKTLNLENTKADATALEAETARAQGAEAALGEAIGKKVDAVEGKGLSTEDYTTEEKEKLDGIEAGAQKNVTPVSPAYENAGKPADAAELYRIISSLTDLINEVYSNVGKIEYGYIPTLLPRYSFADAAIVDGVVTVAPYTNARIESDGTAFTVAVGGESGFMRDCVLCVECGDTAPTITWSDNFHPRTDKETDFACVAGVRNVYWITEHSQGKFCVAGWQETDGGNADVGE